jgi:hypothetical protein
MLLFKKKFLELIRSGTKTQTVRIWPKHRVKVGQKDFVPGLGAVRITGFEAIRPEELTDADARADGFETIEALLKELRETYGEAMDTLPCFKITFLYPFDD